MSTIPVEDADGTSGLAICLGQRGWLVSRYRTEAALALKFFSDALPVAEGDAGADTRAIEHLRTCPRCRSWLHHVVPADVLTRQRRLTRYCCAAMFVACEEAGTTKNRITFELFRGEDPCWKMDGFYSFLSFCPWCGKVLPDKPFIQEPE